MKTLTKIRYSQTKGRTASFGLSVSGQVQSPYYSQTATDRDNSLTLILMKAIISNFHGNGNNINVDVFFKQSDDSGAGPAFISIPLAPVNSVDDIYAALPAAIDAFCDNASIDRPSVLMYMVDKAVDWSFITGKPSFAAVATSGAYSDLSGKPSIASPYEGITGRSGSFPIFKSVTVGSGVAVFHLTADGTSTGTALFPNGVIADSVNATVSDATASYQMSWAFSNSNKTLTVTANKLTTSNILTGILGQAAANSASVKLSVWGY